MRQLCAAMHSGVRHGHLTSFVVFGQQSNKESGPIVHAVMYINNSGLGRGDSHHTTARLLRKRSRWHILGLANRPPMTVGPLCTSSVCAVSSRIEWMVVACTWLNSSSRKRFERTGITGVRCFVSRRPSDCKCCHTEPHCKTRVLSRPGCSS